MNRFPNPPPLWLSFTIAHNNTICPHNTTHPCVCATPAGQSAITFTLASKHGADAGATGSLPLAAPSSPASPMAKDAVEFAFPTVRATDIDEVCILAGAGCCPTGTAWAYLWHHSVDRVPRLWLPSRGLCSASRVGTPSRGHNHRHSALLTTATRHRLPRITSHITTDAPNPTHTTTSTTPGPPPLDHHHRRHRRHRRRRRSHHHP